MTNKIMDMIVALFAFCVIASLALFLAGFFIFASIEVKQKDRELSIREREIELKAQQNPYKSEAKIEVTHD